MNVSIPFLIVGDVIDTQGFIAEVVETKVDTYLQRSVVYLKYISGNRFNFNSLGSSKNLSMLVLLVMSCLMYG